MGLAAAIVSYFLIAIFDSFYGEIIPALLIGAVCGFVSRGKSSIMWSALISAVGWLLGAILFGEIMNLGVGSWIIASLFLVIGTMKMKSIIRVGIFFLIALFSGIAIEISRYLTLLELLRTMDMQLLLLITAGILLPFICVIACGESRKQHHETSEIWAA